ncbi:MAG: hypothetical protein Q9159_006137 [Coniocarpon cinnabarinum]
MDPLSVTASVIAVVQLSAQVFQYLRDVKDAPKECEKCKKEVLNNQILLSTLQGRLDEAQPDQPWFKQIERLNDADGPLCQYKQALEELWARIAPQHGLQKVKGRLLWKFSKKEVESIFQRMERLARIEIQKDTFSIRRSLRDSHAQQQHDLVMQWLSPIDFDAQQYDIISRRQDGTSQWFLDSPEFKRWMQGPCKTLFCPGIPGAGKTMMAAVTVEYLIEQAESDRDIGVAYLFCSYKAQIDQTTRNLCAAMLRQLVKRRPDLGAPAVDLYNRNSQRGSKPSLDELMQAIKSICSSCSTTYIVIDALDEWSPTSSKQSHLISTMQDLQDRGNVRVLCTSRFLPAVEQFFQSDSRLEVRASEQDIRRYIAGQISQLPSRIRSDEEIQKDLQDKIIKAADGMFLLARLHFDSLLDKTTPKKVRVALSQLREGSEAIDHAYKDAIDRIDRQLAGHRDLARKTLAWMTYAQRLLKTEELRHALAIEPDESSLDEQNLNDVEVIVSVCAGLVMIDEKSGIIRLTHYTIQEFLERVLSDWQPCAQEEIATDCVRYVSFDTFRSGSCTSDASFEQRLAENPFFEYAACCWSMHLQPLQQSRYAAEAALALLRNEALVDSASQAALAPAKIYKYHGYSQEIPGHASGLHLLARCGLSTLTERLLERGSESSHIDINEQDDRGRTPLSWAAQHGHEAVVQLLLETGQVDIDAKDDRGRTPLLWATIRGYEAIVSVLLTARADVNAKEENSQTPLSWAAWYGHKAIVQLLLEAGADVDAKGWYGFTPLLSAVVRGHGAVVQLLLEAGADVDAKDKYGQTPLSLAAKEGKEAVIPLLLEAGADVNAKGE